MGNVKGDVDARASYTVDLLPPRRPAFSAAWSAPPATARPTALVGRPREPVQVLDSLVDDVEGVRGALLASVDGFGVAQSSSMSGEPAHPAMLAAAVGLAHQLAAMGGGQHLRQLVVDHDAGLMLVWPIGVQRVLAVLAATTVEQRRVRSFVHTHAAALSEVLSP